MDTARRPDASLSWSFQNTILRDSISRGKQIQRMGELEALIGELRQFGHGKGTEAWDNRQVAVK